MCYRNTCTYIVEGESFVLLGGSEKSRLKKKEKTRNGMCTMCCGGKCTVWPFWVVEQPEQYLEGGVVFLGYVQITTYNYGTTYLQRCCLSCLTCQSVGMVVLDIQCP